MGACRWFDRKTFDCGFAKPPPGKRKLCLMTVAETRPQGVVPIIPTLFDSHEEMDLTATTACVRFAVDSHLSAVCLPAYGSEFYKLSEAEREQARQKVADRVKLVAADLE